MDVTFAVVVCRSNIIRGSLSAYDAYFQLYQIDWHQLVFVYSGSQKG